MRILANSCFRLVRRSDKCFGFAAGVAALMVVAGTVSAQSPNTAPTSKSNTRNESPSTPETAERLRRIETVTWNPVTDELTWVVSAGVSSSGTYKPESSLTYVIHLGSAKMVFNGESRSFSRDEADKVRTLIDVLGRYAAESTIWWEAGEGQKPEDANPGPGQEGGQETKPKPPPKPAGVPLAARAPESNSEAR